MSKSVELKTILPVLGNLTNEELQEVIDYVTHIDLDRKSLRKKELWGNVVAAINKYEQEVESITGYCELCNEEFDIHVITDEPGYISIY